MPELIGWAIVVIAWLVACWLALVYVALPLTLASVALGLSVGAAIAAVGFLRVYRGLEDERAVVRPSASMKRRLRAPYPYWDLGWPNYLSHQVEHDIAAATVWPRSQVNSWWRAAARWASDHRELLVLSPPFLLPPVVFLIMVTIGVYVAATAYAAAVELVTAPPRLARAMSIGSIRVADAAIQWWRGAAATCASCHRVAQLPGFKCKNAECTVIHRDLRPGHLGVLFRRCDCGARLPTTVWRATRELAPVCAACGQPLHHGAGAIPDARIAISGGPSAGKTVMLTDAAVVMTRSTEGPAAWEPADRSARAWLDSARNFATGRFDGEPLSIPDAAPLTLRGRAQRDCYAHFTEVPSGNDAFLRPLSTTRRHVLVLDGTMIPSTAAQAVARIPVGKQNEIGNNGLVPAQAYRPMVELPYHLLVARLNNFGVRSRRCSLAVVVSKADLLAESDVMPDAHQPDTSSKLLRDWLCLMGLRSLVELAEADFDEVRYFLLGSDTASADRPAPFVWLLSKRSKGIGVP